MKKIFERMSFNKLLVAALFIRLLLLPFSFHSDLNNNAIWGIYSKEFGFRGFYDWLNFGNYARPDYPPLAMFIFRGIREIWQLLFNVFWKINISIKLFPSNFIPWFETKGYLALLKLPGVIADMGIGIFLYKIVREKRSEIIAKKTASLFLFNLPIIYLSSSWGQLDSVVSFFALVSLSFLLKRKYYRSLIFYLTSIMIKATYVPTGLLIMIKSFQQKIKFRKIPILSFLALSYLFLLGFIFYDKNYILWTTDTYFKKILPGAITLPYINLNAFNFWGLILGLERIPDSNFFFGLSLNFLAWAISSLFVLVIVIKFIKKESIYFSLLVLYFALYMFMPRVHERYLYPIFVFFPLVLLEYKKLLKPFLFLSFIFLINLYHWWWFPRINLLVQFFDLEIVERTFSLMNLLIFAFILKTYLVSKKTK